MGIPGVQTEAQAETQTSLRLTFAELLESEDPEKLIVDTVSTELSSVGVIVIDDERACETFGQDMFCFLLQMSCAMPTEGRGIKTGGDNL